MGVQAFVEEPAVDVLAWLVFGSTKALSGGLPGLLKSSVTLLMQALLSRQRLGGHGANSAAMAMCELGTPTRQTINGSARIEPPIRPSVKPTSPPEPAPSSTGRVRASSS